MIHKTWTQQRLFRLLGVVSIVVALFAVAGDEILQYSPQGYASLTLFYDLPLWRMLIGHVLGVLFIPLCLSGYWCVCQALRLNGVKGARAMFWFIAYGLMMGAISHDSVSAVIELKREGSGPGLTPIMNYLQNYVNIPGGIFLLCYLAISIWYFAAVISGRTLYPRWMAFVNPFLLSLLIALLHLGNVLPAAVNVLWPAWLSIAHVVFFALSTWTLWNFTEEHATNKEQVAPSPSRTG